MSGMHVTVVKAREFVSHLFAAILRPFCNVHERIGQVRVMFAGFEDQDALARQRAAGNAAVARAQTEAAWPASGIRYVVFMQYFLGHRHPGTLVRKGVAMLAIQYRPGLTDDEPWLTALLLEYAVRYAGYRAGRDAAGSRAAGLECARQYRRQADPSGAKAEQYAQLAPRFEG